MEGKKRECCVWRIGEREGGLDVEQRTGEVDGEGTGERNEEGRF